LQYWVKKEGEEGRRTSLTRDQDEFHGTCLQDL
jgi:hypothetical protein